MCFSKRETLGGRQSIDWSGLPIYNPCLGQVSVLSNEPEKCTIKQSTPKFDLWPGTQLAFSERDFLQ